MKQILIILSLMCSTMQVQSQTKIVGYPYDEACLRIDKLYLDSRILYDNANILLFENDSLFQDVCWLEMGPDTIAIPQNCLSQSLTRIEIIDHHDYIYLLDANRKALAICYPDETEFEIQWLANGKNSMLKQWEIVTININYDFDESMENLCISYDDVIFERLVDRDGNPEDFELSISYWDKDGDGKIEYKNIKKITPE